MERQVKERLVGAAVLMAAAIILIPEMLSGPDRHAEAGPGNQGGISFGAGAAGDAPIKTYTIDLTKPPGAQRIGSEDDRLPPPEDTPEAQVPQPAAGERSATRVEPQQAGGAKAETTRNPSDAAATEARPAAGTSGQREPTAAAPPDKASASTTRGNPDESSAPPASRTSGKSDGAAAPPPSRSLASSRATPTSGGWAVQLGSFSRRSTAETMVKQLRGKGHDAFVMPVKSGATTLYRVRVGPMKDRTSAEAARRKLRSIVPAATVVTHP